MLLRGARRYSVLKSFRLVNIGQGQFVVLVSRYRFLHRTLVSSYLPLAISALLGSPDHPRLLMDTRCSLNRARSLTLPGSPC